MIQYNKRKKIANLFQEAKNNKDNYQKYSKEEIRRIFYNEGVNVEYICTLPEKAKKKDCSGCEHCGWEAAEAERRRAYLCEHGLTLCADGLRRLIISKNGGTEELKYKVCDHCGAHLDNGETCDCRNTNNDGGEPKDKQKERKNDNDGN